MTLLIIFTSLFVTSLVLLSLCIYAEWDVGGWFTALIILLMVSGFGMVISAGLVKPNIKPVEYPISEYNFKIKVVEFEEQRDTILVVTPKEKIK